MQGPAPLHLTLPAGIALVALVVVSSVPQSTAVAQRAALAASVPGLPPELEQARAALDKYQDPVLAVHDGYLSTIACVEYPKGGGDGTMHYAPGGMGVHFLNLPLIGTTTLDPTKPQVLIYEPEGDKLRLAAAEWFVPASAVGDQPPTIFGQALMGPMEGHVPLQPKDFHHYDLHVWLWKKNPAGTFSATNPAVKCPRDGYSFAETAPRMVGHSEH